MLALYGIISTVGCISESGTGPLINEFGCVILDLTHLMCNLYNAVIWIAGAVATLVLVLAGLKYVEQSDNPEQRKKAINTVKNVILGLLFILLANEIAHIVVGFKCGAGAGAIPSTIVGLPC